MKFNRTHIALALAASLSLTGCFDSSSDKKTSEPDVVVPPAAAPSIDVEVNGNIIDSATGFVISGSTLTFLSEGAPTDAARLLDDTLSKVSEITSENGSFTFGFDDQVSLPSITILVEADGYLAQTKVFNIVDAADKNSLAFTLKSETTTGLKVVKETSTVTNGVVAEEVKIGAAAESGATEVAIPAGVVLQDADGNPIAGSDITFQVVAVDTESAGKDAIDITKLLPEGIQDETSTDIFVPLAATVINFTDENGNAIKSFSAPITVVMNVPAKDGLSEGDQLSFKSYDEIKGVWKEEESSVTLGALKDGFFPGTFQISTLSTKVAGEKQEAALCSQASTINFTGDAAIDGLLFDMTRSISGGFNTVLSADTAQLALSGKVASTETANITVTDSVGNTWAEVEGASICGAVDVSLTGPGPTISENLTINAQCSNDATVTSTDAGASVTYRAAGTQFPFSSAGSAGDGVYSLSNLTDGSTYDVNVNSGLAGVEDFSLQITADGSDESTTIALECSTGTGTGGTGG